MHYCSATNEFLLLNNRKQSLLESHSLDELESVDPELFELLKTKRFIVPCDLDETQKVTESRMNAIFDKSWYNVVVNTTLDCNLNCWYCYENRIKGSRLSDEVISQICQNISSHYEHSPYTLLKLSFFGGEPFMNWKGMRTIIEYGNEFCKKHGLGLLLDFTTNATLITESMVEFLSGYRCVFQITLDGSESVHNTIKKSNDPNVNCYRRTLNALRLINAKITDRLIALRINFDQRSLEDIDTIISDISFLNRRRSYVIVKKVWQVDTSDIDKEQLLTVLQKLFDNNFLPDYYVMPKHGVCFAERVNQVLFNFDGQIFKCTTIDSFDEKNSLGHFDRENGLVKWDEQLLNDWTCDMQQPECLRCKWYGACYGPCNRQLLAHKGEFICTFDAMNLSQKEYLMYLFKYNVLFNQLNSTETTTSH